MLRICLCFFLLSLVLGCPTADDPVDDDDSGDDDDAIPCAWALESTCADVVVDAAGGAGPTGDPNNAVNGVRGGGQTGGGTDVYSLNYGEGASLTVRWSGRRVLNGPGLDVVVFENAFEYGSQGAIFMDLAIVEVSTDGNEWVAFPHDYIADDEEVYSDDPSAWSGFAGRTPVLLHEEDNPVDPVDPSVAGGDGFDLDDLPDEGPGAAIKVDGFVFLRIVTAPSVENPDTGAPYPFAAISNGADIDGVYAATLAAE